MNDSFLVSLPSSFPSKLFKSTKYEYDFNHQRTKRTLDLRRNSPLGLQKSKTYNSKLSESLDVFGPNKLLSSLTLRLDKKTQNFYKRPNNHSNIHLMKLKFSHESILYFILLFAKNNVHIN